MFGIVWMYNKAMNTPSMIVGPSIILLQPHVGWFHAGRFLASDFWFSRHFSAMFGHQVVLCHLLSVNIAKEGQFMGTYKVMNTLYMFIGPSISLLQPLVQVSKPTSSLPTQSTSSKLSGSSVWPWWYHMTSCRYYNADWLALSWGITRW